MNTVTGFEHFAVEDLFWYGGIQCEMDTQMTSWLNVGEVTVIYLSQRSGQRDLVLKLDSLWCVEK